ncbi:hypothetical protein PAMA_011077 [Pampus argenteus]
MSRTQRKRKYFKIGEMDEGVEKITALMSGLCITDTPSSLTEDNLFLCERTQRELSVASAPVNDNGSPERKRRKLDLQANN